MNKDYKAKLLEKALSKFKMYYIGIVRKILFRQRN